MEESQVVNPFEEFEEDVREAVDGLLHLGHLEAEVEFAGHTFGLRTLRVAEELAAAKAMEPYRDTFKEPEAWMAAQVGLALTHVDGEDDFCPAAGPDRVAFARARFQYVTTKWYQPTVEYLYLAYTSLLKKQVNAIRAVQDLSQRDLRTSLPWADSLSDKGTFSAES